MGRNGGFTLVEVLVASLLTAMLVTSMYRLLLGGARIFTKVQVHSELQDQALIGLSHLATELHAASWRSISIQAGAVSFTTAQLAPGQFVTYYLDAGTHRLMRGITQSAGATRITPTGAGLTQLSVVAQHVETFTLTPESFPNHVPAAQAIQATLQLAAPTGSTVTRETASIASAPRN